jgi:hypothetical protein
MANCQCGCGGEVSIATRNYPKFGHVKGQPVRFIPGHSNGPPLEERFHDRVAAAGPDDCWLWTGGRLPAGYGALWDKRINNNRATHRLAWELANGPIPDGLWVLHRCDNPPCCNPAHLFLGTQAENDADRTVKGRSSRGDHHPDSKLSEQVVPEIRRRFAAGEHARDLAVEYGVSSTTLWQAATGKTWRHVG